MMLRSRNVLFVLYFLTVICGVVLHAAVPPLMSFQGRLTNASGQPLTDTLSITFKIYGVMGGGVAIWQETQPAVPVISGIFSVQLGSISPLSPSVFKDTDPGRFLGITVGADPELPRQQIITVPYAFLVKTVNEAEGGDIIGPVSVGDDNTVTSGVFAAGYFNEATGVQSVAVGGSGNIADGNVAAVFGGSGNTASGDHANVSGEGNQANGGWSVVSGGAGNKANALYSTVGGGRFNDALAFGATVPGGENNDANASYSFAAGFRAKANHQGAFVWGDSSNSDFASTAQDQFLIRARGGVGIGTNDPKAPLHVQEGNTGVTASTASVGIFERTGSSFVSILSPDVNERGVLFADGNSAADGGVIFNSPNNRRGMQFRTGGNSTKMSIDSLGNVGIGDGKPNARLHVADGSVGDAYDANALVALESNDRFYQSFNGPDNQERGLIFGYDTDPDAAQFVFNDQSFARRGLTTIVGNFVAMVIDSVGKVGIFDSSPTSRLDIGGSMAIDPDVITGSATLGESHGIVVFGTPAGAHTITLPLANTCPGRIYYLKVSGFNVGTINITRSGADLIDNLTTYTMTAAYDFVQLVSDGDSRWLIISERP